MKKKEAVLHAQPLPGLHTGEALCREYNAMLSKWNIEKGQFHLILRDNASNMIKAMDQGDFEHWDVLPIRTLQPIVHDGIFSQRAAIDPLAVC